MFYINEAMVDISIGTAGLVGLLGYLVVFFGLILLMLVIMLVGRIMSAKNAAPAPTAEAAPVQKKTDLPEAKGTAGELKLHDVPDREAAILMAIVAYKLKKPLNTLRFKSIKEVK